MTRRNQNEIIECILNTCKEPAAVTKIVYKCNLNFGKAHPHIEDLMASGCLIEISEMHRKHYKTTEKGNQVLEHFHVLRELLKPL